MKLLKLRGSSRTTEVDALLKQLIALHNSAAVDGDIYLSQIFDELKPLSKKMTSAINQTYTESLLEEKDSIRDDAVRSIYFLLQGYIHHPDAIIQSAAGAISKIFNSYGIEMVRESYAVESSLVDSMLKQFGEEESASHIATLPGLSELVVALLDAETDFENCRLAYEKEKASESQRSSATALKKEIVETVNGKLVLYLQAMLAVDEPKYGDLVRTTAELINVNNSAVKKRKSKPEMGN